MQPVSNAWKTLHTENILPVPADIQIKYAATDIDAMNHATVSTNSKAAEVTDADLQSIVRNGVVYQPTQTLELNKWILDGSILVSDSYSKGYISGYTSGDNKSFSTAPIVTITFDQTRTIASQGVVVRFSSAYNEYATDFVVKAYLNSSQVASATVTGNNKVEAEVAIAIQNYNKIEITINKWCLPQSRARMESISIGATKTFTKSDIISYKQNMKSSLFSFSLPDYNIEFEFDNTDDEWNPDNPTGVYQSLAQRQEIDVKYGYEINGSYEYISGGTYFLSEWNTPQNGITARFKARDLTIFMQDKFNGSSYEGQTMSYQALANAAFVQSNIPTFSDGSVRWDTTDLASAPVQMPSGLSQYTCAEIVQLCCVACACVMRYGRDGKMYCEQLDTTTQDYQINRFNSYQDAEYEMSQALRGVDINNGQFSDTVGTTGEIQYVTNPIMENMDSGEATQILQYIEDHLSYRRTLTGQYRADPRLDVFDYITVVNKFATMVVVITTLNLSYNGMFTATYEGRVEA